MRISRESLIVLVIFLTIVGCSTTNSSSTRYTNQENQVSSNEELSLEDHLRRLNGVRVIGSGTNIRVQIRSHMSISNANEQPLYIVDGQQVGRSFARAQQLVVKGNIKSVEAIPPSRASEYGIQGGAGVIIIKTMGSLN
jgi:hypothetical protein